MDLKQISDTQSDILEQPGGPIAPGTFKANQMKIKTFLKQLFCLHKYPETRVTWRKEATTIDKKCSKCGYIKHKIL